jgi:hypothetical protein
VWSGDHVLYCGGTSAQADFVAGKENGLELPCFTGFGEMPILSFMMIVKSAQMVVRGHMGSWQGLQYDQG